MEKKKQKQKKFGGKNELKIIQITSKKYLFTESLLNPSRINTEGKKRNYT